MTCALGATSTEARVALAEQVAMRLALRVWPTDLRADDPTAELSVVLDDVRGERMATDGVVVSAERGEVSVSADAAMAQGTYDGSAAIASGRDVIVAKYAAPPGEGPVAEVVVGTGAVPRAASTEGVVVFGRALDASRRPIRDALLTLGIGDRERTVRTGEDGWAQAPVRTASDREPLVVFARTRWRSAEGIAIPDRWGRGARGRRIWRRGGRSRSGRGGCGGRPSRWSPPSCARGRAPSPT